MLEPATCTELALSAAVFAAATISVGDFDATPLPEELPPQPASAATASASDRPAADWRPRRITGL
jgi:hypothetical protein